METGGSLELCPRGVDLSRKDTESSLRRKRITAKQRVNKAREEQEREEETRFTASSPRKSPWNQFSKHKDFTGGRYGHGDSRELVDTKEDSNSDIKGVKERMRFDARVHKDRRSRRKKQKMTEVNEDALNQVLKQLGYTATQEQLDALRRGIQAKLAADKTSHGTSEEVVNSTHATQDATSVSENEGIREEKTSKRELKQAEPSCLKHSKGVNTEHIPLQESSVNSVSDNQSSRNISVDKPTRKTVETASSTDVIRALERQLPKQFRQALQLERGERNGSYNPPPPKYAPPSAQKGVRIRPLKPKKSSTFLTEIDEGTRTSQQQDSSEAEERRETDRCVLADEIQENDATAKSLVPPVKEHVDHNRNKNTIDDVWHDPKSYQSTDVNYQQSNADAKVPVLSKPAHIHPREMGSIQKFLTRQEEARKTKEEQEKPHWTTGENWTASVTKPEPFNLHAGDWTRCAYKEYAAARQEEDREEEERQARKKAKQAARVKKRFPKVNWSRIFEITGMEKVVSRSSSASESTSSSPTFPSFVQLRYSKEGSQDSTDVAGEIEDAAKVDGQNEETDDDQKQASSVEEQYSHHSAEQMNPIEALKWHYKGDASQAENDRTEEIYSSSIIRRPSKQPVKTDEDREKSHQASGSGGGTTLLDEVLASLSSDSYADSQPTRRNRVSSTDSTPLPSIAETLSENDDSTEYQRSPAPVAESFNTDDTGIQEHVLDVSSIKAYHDSHEAADEANLMYFEDMEEDEHQDNNREKSSSESKVNIAYVGNSQSHQELAYKLDNVVHTMNVRRGLKVTKPPGAD